MGRSTSSPSGPEPPSEPKPPGRAEYDCHRPRPGGVERRGDPARYGRAATSARRSTQAATTSARVALSTVPGGGRSPEPWGVFWQETWLGRGLAGLTRLSPGRVDLLASGVVVIAAWIAYTIVNHDRRANLDYFVPLAEALLHGRLWLTEGPSWLNELVPVDG